MSSYLLFPGVYAAVSDSGSQKGDNFRVKDRVSLVLLTSLLSVKICGRRWAEESEQWTGYKLFIFLLPSSRASRKTPRLPRLAHKVPVL